MPRIFALKKCFDAFQNSTDAQRTFREIIFLQVPISRRHIKSRSRDCWGQELNGHENIVRLMNVPASQAASMGR